MRLHDLLCVRSGPYALAVVASVVTVTLAGCSGPPPPDQAQFAAPRAESGTQGEILGAAGLGSTEVSANNEKGSTGIGVNAYLWRGTLDTLAFMPLSSADPFGGVIITDWYQPPATPGERFKATAYILGRELRADGIRIAIFRQVLQNGRWINADVAPSTVSEIEDKVLVRARELRARGAG